VKVTCSYSFVMISSSSGRMIFVLGIHNGDCSGCLLGFDTM
jgi:hypothetical protein